MQSTVVSLVPAQAHSGTAFCLRDSPPKTRSLPEREQSLFMSEGGQGVARAFSQEQVSSLQRHIPWYLIYRVTFGLNSPKIFLASELVPNSLPLYHIKDGFSSDQLMLHCLFNAQLALESQLSLFCVYIKFSLAVMFHNIVKASPSLNK